VPQDLKPARGVARYREEGRERFLTTPELGRLGDALREAETVGIPWTIDEAKATAKHVPKENRRTRVSPFATAALRLLLFTGCRLRANGVRHERAALCKLPTLARKPGAQVRTSEQSNIPSQVVGSGDGEIQIDPKRMIARQAAQERGRLRMATGWIELNG